MLKILKLYYFLVGLPYVLLIAGAIFFFAPLKRVILNNPIPHLNYAIIVIVLTGGIFILNNARRLIRQASIMREFSAALRKKTDGMKLREMAGKYTGSLACVLQMIAASGDRAISHQEQAALEHELANARSRLVRRNALPQYLTGLLVAMGLLGTFIGLLATLSDISVLIGSFADLDMSHVEPIQIFRVMIERMKAPMSSMGIAFSTSMFGLLGSIVIGLMMLGIRRLQGDIFSVLSSEVASHIETALSFESISFRGGDPRIGGHEEASDFTAKILLRIEERLAEAARIRQRALTAEIDDFKKQRAEMLQALTVQNEANSGFRDELRELGAQLANIFTSMEKSSGAIDSQVSSLTVQLAGDARETQKLLALQIEEQKRLKDTLDAYNIEEWLTESTRIQQRVLAAEIEDFKDQRAEVVRALAEQTETNKISYTELMQLGKQLGDILASIEKGGSEISSQLSELTVHVGAEAKESQRLLSKTTNNLRGELQQIGSRLETLISATGEDAESLAARLDELTAKASEEGDQLRRQLSEVGSDVRGTLLQVGHQLETNTETTQKGSGEIVSQLVVLTSETSEQTKLVREELRQLIDQFGALDDTTRNGHSETIARISDLTGKLSAEAKGSRQVLENAGGTLRVDLQQLGHQLGTIADATEKSSGVLANQLAELMGRLSAGAGESFPPAPTANPEAASPEQGQEAIG